MECLKFGEKKVVDIKGNLVEVGEFSIHLQRCSWRFVNETEILVGSQDLYEPEDEDTSSDENFDWGEKNLRDKKLQNIIDNNELTVQQIHADSYGGAEIMFLNQIKLQIFPDSSKNDDYAEFWRLLNNRTKKQIGVSILGIDESE